MYIYMCVCVCVCVHPSIYPDYLCFSLLLRYTKPALTTVFGT